MHQCGIHGQISLYAVRIGVLQIFYQLLLHDLSQEFSHYLPPWKLWCQILLRWDVAVPQRITE